MALCVRASLLPMSCAVVEVLEWVADVLDNHGRQIGPRLTRSNRHHRDTLSVRIYH